MPSGSMFKMLKKEFMAKLNLNTNSIYFQDVDNLFKFWVFKVVQIFKNPQFLNGFCCSAFDYFKNMIVFRFFSSFITTAFQLSKLSFVSVSSGFYTFSTPPTITTILFKFNNLKLYKERLL